MPGSSQQKCLDQECTVGMYLNLSASVNCPSEFPLHGSCGELGSELYARHGGRNSQPVTSALLSNSHQNLLVY